MPSSGGAAPRPHIPRGLEWLPSPGAPSLPSPRPLVVILPWMWAARAAVAKQAALYHSFGCDVAVFRWPALAVWVPALARWNASSLLCALAVLLEQEPRRDVILACFSGAAKGVLGPLLEQLSAVQPPAPATATSGAGNIAPSGPASATVAAHAAPVPVRAAAAAAASAPNARAVALRARLRGVLFDSGPVDFDSAVGVRLFATSRLPAVRALQAAAGAAAAGTLDFLLYEAFESQRRAMWVGLRSGLASLRLPVAFLYSWAGDRLADPQPIHALAEALRRGGELPLEAAARAAAEGRTGGSGSSVFSLGFWRARVFAGAGSPVVQAQARINTHASAAGPAAAVAAAPRVAEPLAVQEQGWDCSGHVAHLREHPEDYRMAVAAFLQRCLGGGGGAAAPAYSAAAMAAAAGGAGPALPPQRCRSGDAAALEPPARSLPSGSSPVTPPLPPAEAPTPGAEAALQQRWPAGEAAVTGFAAAQAGLTDAGSRESVSVPAGTWMPAGKAEPAGVSTGRHPEAQSPVEAAAAADGSALVERWAAEQDARYLGR